MKNFKEYIIEHLINEGGMGGHMSHPFDYDDLTFGDLEDMIRKLFNGDVIEMKEKLDGTNIQATVNLKGDVVFIRNKGDLNSENGGMSIEDMANKWKDKPSVAKNYIKAGEIIKKIFSKVPGSYFHPDDTTRVIVNCECISAGQTNVMLYERDRVAFHGIAIYKKQDNGKWELKSETEGEPKEIRKAAEGIDEASPRPRLLILNAENARLESQNAISKLHEMMKSYHLKASSTIDDYKHIRYEELSPLWARNEKCYARLVNNDKSINIRELKKEFPEIQDFENSSQKKALYRDIMEPIEHLFSYIGNALISLLSGLANAGLEDKVVKSLNDELDKVKKYVDNEGSDEMKDLMARSLQRLSKLNNKINATEGIVFQYKGKLMKLTGAFSALNQALGVKFMK